MRQFQFFIPATAAIFYGPAVALRSLPSREPSRDILAFQRRLNVICAVSG
jgi:hypothetical protein